MYQLDKKDMNKISMLFQGWEETPIWSCLQGYMGNAWADRYENPQSAQIIIGDLCFFAGVPNLELVQNIPSYFKSESILMVPQNEEWGRLIEQEYKDNHEKTKRYAIKKEPDVFDKKKLTSYIDNLPTGYQLKMIDEELYYKCRSEKWSWDLCSQFQTYDQYKKFGLGAVILHNDKIVSGASSYTVYKDGIEIEVDTKPEYRRRGLALICAAKLILECLDRGLYPSWDAANIESVALSEKLGYHFDKEYVTYSVKVVKSK